MTTALLLRRSIPIVLLLCILSTPVSAQWYIQGSAGHAFGLSSRYWDARYSDRVQGVYKALAEGFVLDLGVGYMIDTNYGVELGGSVLFGSHDDIPAVGATSRNRISVSVPALVPSVVLVLPVAEEIALYTKAGVCMVFPTVTIEDNVNNSPHGGSGFDYTGGMGIGARGAIGVRTTGSGTVLFLEAALTQVTWRATEPAAGYYGKPQYDLGNIAVRAGVNVGL